MKQIFIGILVVINSLSVAGDTTQETAKQPSLIRELSYGYDFELTLTDCRKYYALRGELYETLNGTQSLFNFNHSSIIPRLTVSPCGQYIASESLYEDSVKIYSFKTGELIATIQHDLKIKRLKFSACGEYITASSLNEDSNAIISNAKTGELVTEIKNDYKRDIFVFSPCKKYIAHASGQTAHIFTRGGKYLHTIKHEDDITMLLFSSCSQFLILRSDSETEHPLQTTLIELKSGRFIIREIDDENDVDITDYLDIKYFVSLYDRNEKNIVVENAKTNETVAEFYLNRCSEGEIVNKMLSLNEQVIPWGNSPLKNRMRELINTLHEIDQRCIIASPCKNYFAFELGKTIRITDAQSKPVATIRHENIAEPIFSPCGAYLATFDDKSLKICKLETGEAYREMNDELIHEVLFSPHGKYIAIFSHDRVKIFDIEKSIFTGNTPIGDFGDFQHALFGFSACESYLATADKNTIRIFETKTGKTISSVMHYLTEASPCGKYLATVSENWVKISDAKTGELLSSLEVDSDHSNRNQFYGNIDRIAFSPCGEYVAVNHFFYHAKTLEPIICYDDFVPDWRQISPCGKYKLRSLQDRTISLIHAISRDPIMSIDDYYHAPTASFCSSGDCILSKSAGMFKLWDIQTGKLKSTFKYNKAQTHQQALSPCGTYRAVSSGNMLRIYRGKTAELIMELEHEATIDTFSFFPCGQYLKSSSIDHEETERIIDLKSATVLTSTESMPSPLSPCGKYGLTIELRQNKSSRWREHIIIIETKTGSTLAVIPNELDIKDLYLSACGKYIIALSEEERDPRVPLSSATYGNLRIWDISYLYDLIQAEPQRAQE